MNIGILGIGGYVPDRVVTNETVAQWAGVSTHWLEERTGVLTRRYAPCDMTTSELGYLAVQDLLRRDEKALDGLETIIFVTTTPDQPLPATAAILQKRIGIARVSAFDVNAVCSGFLYGLVVGATLAGNGGGRVLVVAADMYSRIMDRTDRKTVSLFGDGAGVALLGPLPEGYGLLSHRMISDGELYDLIEVRAGGTRMPTDEMALEKRENLLRMQGKPIRDYVLGVVPDLVHEVLAEAEISLDQVDRFILHQANPRLLECLAERMGIDPGRVPMTAPYLGNTAVASIPLTLCAAHAERPLRRGERIVMAAVGGGMNAAAAVLIWH
jgi:3-oxoacyl-(acyl-carrier-protein) synthase III